jgi:hypothetical protein
MRTARRLHGVSALRQMVGFCSLRHAVRSSIERLPILTPGHLQALMSQSGQYVEGRWHPPPETQRTTRAISAPRDSQCLFASVPKLGGFDIVNQAIFRSHLTEGDGLKNRCRERQKNAIGQVLACRMLTVCGEVAEKLKAAVC